ncbi:hybrid sensor histidine kinase/response regulator [Sodalinema gerasimenkoae]|uniref:hybrid sensor histidine kinase/response regulator n=1 Tax=Sodalinema gerasimenkoae TaxID=2862348 RepID=UPI001358065F|nr:hybrid sensor histidine kinase/response regulator [Sodalinema gerasimenkoae]
MDCLNLQPFLQPVPVCYGLDRLEAVLDELQQSDRILLIDDDQTPLGVMFARHLLGKLRDPQVWQEPLLNLKAAITPIESVSIRRLGDRLCSRMSLDTMARLKLFEAVAGVSRPEVVIVDGLGSILGLLDCDRLEAELIAPRSDRLPPDSTLPSLDVLTRLLDLLPLPLRLQDLENRVIHENPHWQTWQGQLCDRPALLEACDLRDRPQDNSPYHLGQFSQDDRQPHPHWHLTAISLNHLLPQPQCRHPSPPLWLLLAQQAISMPKQTQELTAKNADLIQMDRQKTELLSWVGHELKTPLTALLGLSNLLQNPNLGSLNPRQANYARLIQQSSRQMMTVVNDLCDLAQLDNDELSLDLQPLSVQTCSQTAYEQIRKLRDRSPLPNLSLDIAPDADTVLADRTRFCQILVHLLLNAVSTTPDTGTVGLRVERWQHWLAFVIWDTGAGIKPAVQPWIFQGYPLASSSSLTANTETLPSAAGTTSLGLSPSSPSMPAPATGLGLVLAQRLARLHGGEISFTSQEQGGSQFTLLLPSPAYDEGSAPPETTTTFNAWAKEVQVRFALVADRDSQRVEPLGHYLSEAGYRVFLARSGPEALAKTRQLHPCVIFLNPRLPILSGWDVLTLLKADPETQSLPVVLLADDAQDKAIAQRGFEAVVDCLSLPVDRSQMQGVLTRLLARPTQVNPVTRPLTLLWLVSPHRNDIPAALPLERLFHQYHYRVIEVDDLDQAGLLVKVWKPDVVLLDIGGTDSECQAVLSTFQDHPGLMQLPIVTLDGSTTALANRVLTAEGTPLRVFPCLTDPELLSDSSGLPAVIEVIRIAANAKP